MLSDTYITRGAREFSTVIDTERILEGTVPCWGAWQAVARPPQGHHQWCSARSPSAADGSSEGPSELRLTLLSSVELGKLRHREVR